MISLLAPYSKDKISRRHILNYLSPLKEIGVDLETKPIDGENITKYSKWGYCAYTTKTVMLQIGDEHRQFVIDTRYEDISFLKPILESTKIVKVGTNLKYDYQRLKALGINMNNVYDCMITEMVLHCGMEKPKGFYSLAGMATRYLNAYFHINQLSLFEGADFSKGTRAEFANHPDDEPFTQTQISYGANDVKIPILIKRKQEAKIKELDLQNTVDLENRYVTVIGDMEYYGIPLDTTSWLVNEQRNYELLTQMEDELNTYVQEPINWNSHKQVTELFKSLGISTRVKDKKSGKIKDSVAKASMAKKSTEHPIIPKYLEYKELFKAVSSYGSKFLRFVNPFTGRVHSEYWQILNTGRISSNSPNLQNIPGEKAVEFRRCFKAPEGKVLISADYSSQESRVLADVSLEPSMVKFFNENPNPDVHSFVASKMFNKEITSKDKDLRTKGKKTNFTIAYGGGAGKLADEFSVPKSEAQTWIDFYFKAFPKLKKYFHDKNLETLKLGYILIDKTTKRKSFVFDEKLLSYIEFSNRWALLGWRDIPKEISNYISKRLAEIQRLSQNYPIQGLSGSMTKLAGIYFRDAIINKKINAEIVNTIHDEILVVVGKQDAEYVSTLLKDCMIKASNKLLNRVPMEVGIGIHSHWSH